MEEHNTNNDHSEIPAITIRMLKPDSGKKCVEKPNIDGISAFYLSDILSAQRLQLKQCYSVNNTTFQNVILCGTVVNLFHCSNKTIITVDDGTGEIECFLENSVEVQLLRDNLQKRLMIRRLLYEEDKNDKLSKVSLIMLQNAYRSLEKIPQREDLMYGDKVKLIGYVSDYNNKRLIFIKHIVRVDVKTMIHHFNHLNNMYLNIYNK